MSSLIRLAIVVPLIVAAFSVEPSYGNVEIGNWTYYAHGARAGNVTILNNKQILIQGFNYDGQGPEAWFTIGLGKRSSNPLPCHNYRANPIIADENLSCETRPGLYKGKDIQLTLPHEYEWSSIDFVGIYCYHFQHLFGFVKIPSIEGSQLIKFVEPKQPGCKKQHERILNELTEVSNCTPKDTTGGFP